MKILFQGVRLPVELAVIDDRGETFDLSFFVTYARADNKKKALREDERDDALIEIDELVKQMAEEKLSKKDQLKYRKRVANLQNLPINWLREDVLSWDGLMDSDGSEVKFNSAELEQMLANQPFVEAFRQSWSLAHGGVSPEVEQEADSKN